MAISPDDSIQPVPAPETVPDDAKDDIPPGGPQALIKLNDPEDAHRRGMDKTKLTFAIVIVGVSLGVVVLLSVAQWLFQEQLADADELSSAIDWMKIIATTALGFVFGRSTLDRK